MNRYITNMMPLKLLDLLMALFLLYTSANPVFVYFVCFFQSSIASTNAAVPSFQAPGPYAPFSRGMAPSYSQFGSAPLPPQQFGARGAGL